MDNTNCTRSSGKRTAWRLRLACVLAVVAVQSGLPAGHAAGESGWQPLASIRDAAVAEVESASGPRANRIVAVADSIDDRLRLPRCAEPLSTDLPYPSARGQRVTVEVRCDAEQSWRILVPVRLQIYGSVVVAGRTIPRDAILSASDLAMAELDLGKLHRGHISDIQHLIGKKVRRGINAGEPIVPNMVLTPPLIRRGQTVTLKAGISRLSVSMTATALEDGGLGEVIDVTNEASGRVVQGIVRSARVVEVLLD